jgi:hypothetical protein
VRKKNEEKKHQNKEKADGSKVHGVGDMPVVLTTLRLDLSTHNPQPTVHPLPQVIKKPPNPIATPH